MLNDGTRTPANDAFDLDAAADACDGTAPGDAVRERYYDPKMGRFINQDPEPPTEEDARNPYRYAWNDPVDLTDPTGLGAVTGPGPGTPQLGSERSGVANLGSALGSALAGAAFGSTAAGSYIGAMAAPTLSESAKIVGYIFNKINDQRQFLTNLQNFAKDLDSYNSTLPALPADWSNEKWERSMDIMRYGEVRRKDGDGGNIGPYSLGWAWLSNSDDMATDLHFNGHDAFTRELAKGVGAQKTRGEIIKRLGDFSIQTYNPHSDSTILSGASSYGPGFGQYVKDVTWHIPMGWSGLSDANAAHAFVGGYTTEWSISQINPESRTATAHFHGHNTSGWQSITRNPLSRSWSGHDDTTSGLGRNRTQTFDWDEEINY